MGSYMEISLQARKFAILSMKGCCRSVKRHPFLVGLVLFLIFLYRSFPFLFSLLLSASPVLVCTAVLLGTLLSFGQSNIPEIEKEEVFSRDSVSLRTKVSGNNDTFVVERDESFVIERYVGDRRDLADESVEEMGFMDDRVDNMRGDVVDSLDRIPLINENSREVHVEKIVAEKVERGFLDFEFEKKREIVEEEARIEEGALGDGKIVENHYSLVRDLDNDKNLADEKSVGDGKEDHVESSLLGGGNENEIDNDVDDEDESSGSDSDRAESSSPDASMADIIPMLDELHPLLDLDAPQPPHMSNGESDSGSEHSHGSGESDAETGNQGDEAEEDGADDHEDDEEEEEEEEAHEGKEDESKSAIKWTEDDQKNLMDLGTSEIERNQRLENLIARRRARKSFRLMAERNLIDLESADLPFNVPQISTARRNPFDLPDDSYEQMGLPPIPGSAPSILLPRRNPFDLPYDSSEEKPDLKGDNFEQEFLPLHQREMMFRRHESFILGPSGLGGSRSEARYKPVFVPERFSSEGTSVSLFQRQSSEVSESKMSSVPDTDSVSSVADADEKKLSDQDFSREDEIHSEIYESDVAEHGSQSSKDEDSARTSEGRDANRDEVEITLGEVESQHDIDPDLSESHEAADHLERSTSDIHLEAEPIDDERDSSRSSASSSSEVDERIPDVKKEEYHVELRSNITHLEKEPIEEGDISRSSLSDKMSDVKNEDSSISLVAGDDLNDESFISPQPSLEDSNFRFVSGLVDDNEHKDPVYDSSPHATDILLSLSSVSFDTQAEMTEMLKPPASVQDALSFVDREIDLHGDTPGLEEIRPASSQEVAEDEVHAVPQVTGSRDIEVSNVASSEVRPEIVNQSESAVHESGPVHVSVDLGSVLEVKSVEQGRENAEENNPNEHDRTCSSTETRNAVNEHEDATNRRDQSSSEYVTVTSQQEEQVPFAVNRAPVFSNLSTCKSEPLEFWEIVRQEMIHADEHQVHSASSSEKMSVEEEMFGDELVHPEKDEVPASSFDSEIQVESYQDLSGAQLESTASDDSTVAVFQDSQPSSMGNDHEIEHLMDNDESVRSESVQIHSEVPLEEKFPFEKEEEKDYDFKVASSSSDEESLPLEAKSSIKVEREKVSDLKAPLSSSSDHESMALEEKSPFQLENEQDSALKVASSSFDVDSLPLEENNSSQLEKEHDSDLKITSSSSDDVKLLEEVSIPDESVVDVELHVSQEEPATVMDEARGDSRIISVDVRDPAIQVSSATDYSDSTAFPQGSLEYIPHADEIDLKDSILDRAVDDNDTRLSGHADYELESHTAHENIKEDADEISDINEGLLSELDAVGDFGINEVGESLDSDLILEEPNTEAEVLPSASIPKETSTELPLLEVRSFEDIDLAFKQLHEGADVEEVILPSTVRAQLDVEESKSPHEISSDIHIVEAKSLEDLQVALRQVSDDVGESKNESVEVRKVDSASDIEPVKVESGVKEGNPVAADEQHTNPTDHLKI